MNRDKKESYIENQLESDLAYAVQTIRSHYSDTAYEAARELKEIIVKACEEICGNSRQDNSKTS